MPGQAQMLVRKPFVRNFNVVDAQARAGAMCRVNDSVVQIGLADKEHGWHAHAEEDKFFYVVEGGFVIDLEGRTVQLAPKQAFTVPKGVMHRTRTAAEDTMMLIVGSAGT
jgi:mannose-6-phosphate isomerase-like protein (cupin superfamily)